MDKTIIISDKDSIGKQEVYFEFFKCANCDNADLINSFKYCPSCGCELEWNVTKDFSWSEEVTINAGKLLGVSGRVCDFDRRTGKVTIKIDKDNKVIVDYKDIIRKS